MVVRITTEIERVGDLAVNIAERVTNIASRPPMAVPFQFERMAEKTEKMLKSSLDALIKLDADLASGGDGKAVLCVTVTVDRGHGAPAEYPFIGPHPEPECKHEFDGRRRKRVVVKVLGE